MNALETSSSLAAIELHSSFRFKAVERFGFDPKNNSSLANWNENKSDLNANYFAFPYLILLPGKHVAL